MNFNVDLYLSLRSKCTSEERVIINKILKLKSLDKAAKELNMTTRQIRSIRDRIKKRRSVHQEKSKHLYLKKFETHLRFVSVWNDSRSYPTMHDMTRELGIKEKSITKCKERYNLFKKQNPSCNLPDLIWRRSNGTIVPVPKSVFDQLNRFRISAKSIQEAKGLIITGAQFGTTVFSNFLESLKVYSEYKKYPLVVMPIKYGPITVKNGRLTSTFPDELAGHLIFEDTPFANGNLNLNVARFRPTLDKFLTDKVCQMGGETSQIFAAPVIELEHRPRVGHDNPYPKAIMTTGSVSNPNYSVDKLGQQDRTGEVALENHKFGAVLVEIDKTDSSIFHFRHTYADENGNFYDIDPNKGGALWITPEGVQHKPDAIDSVVLGDWHTGKTDSVVREVTFGDKGIIQKLRPKNVFLHDFVDCDSVSHWEKNQGPRRAWKGPLQYDSLELELQDAVKELQWMRNQAPFTKLHVVCSNHNEYVREYIETMRWKNDDINLTIGAQLFVAMAQSLKERAVTKAQADPIDPVIWWFNKHIPEVNSLERRSKFVVPENIQNIKKAVLTSMHGDIGPGGKQTRSNESFQKYNHRVILGHNHVATIYRNVFRVGTSTPRTQHYVTTPTTSWTNSHAVVFDNGQIILVNIIKGRYFR